MAVAPQARPRRPTKDRVRPPSCLGTARLVVVRPPRVALWDGIRVNVQLEEKGDGGVSNSSGCLGSGSAPTAPLYFFPSRNGIGVVVNRILFRFGFGRKFRPKHVSVSAFRLSPLSVIRPKQVFRPKEAVSAEITVSANRGCLVDIMEHTLLFM